MGYGDYSLQAHQTIIQNRAGKAREEVFKQRSVHPLMNPHGVKLRESRDSAEHPTSLGVVFALDVTGSMGAIPEQLARKELPQFMKTLMECKVADPQVLFMFVGDAASDRGPLQVGQFESSATEMDQWLTWSWLEGGGGGNGGESYDLAMYYAARHLAMDCLSKRRKRGYFFMTGDENPYPASSRRTIHNLIGDDLSEDLPLVQLCDELSRSFHPFFLVPGHDRRWNCEETWRKALGDHVIVMAAAADTCYVAAGLVGLCEGSFPSLTEFAQHLAASGLDRPRVAGIVQALTPFASTLRKDGVPQPRLEPVAFPED